MPYISSIAETEWRYPALAPYASGWLEAGRHRVYWETYGNPDGEPVIFLHGGPGGGSSPIFARYFDPARYRIVLFDQRGCGKSQPSAADSDPTPALTENTTGHLISDIAALRNALGIAGKMHVFGGSWGSTLALAYAIAHPETVQTLILRGIFLCRRKDLDYFYQGNAATGDTALPGAYLHYPEAWKPFVEAIPPAERHDMIAAYARRFAEGHAVVAIARAWSVWEGLTSYLAPSDDNVARFADTAFAMAFARIENHYFMNGAFLGGSGAHNRDQDFILTQAARIAHLPIHIVHGRYDQVCPLFQAEELMAALRAAGATRLDLRITAAGHSMLERENHRELTAIMDGLPRMNPLAAG